MYHHSAYSREEENIHTELDLSELGSLKRSHLVSLINCRAAVMMDWAH